MQTSKRNSPCTSLVRFGQTMNSAFTPACNSRSSPTTLALLVAMNPRINLCGSKVDTNFTNEEMGSVGTGVSLRSSNRFSNNFLLRKIFAPEPLWTRFSANSIAWLICLVNEFSCAFTAFNFSVLDKRVLSSVAIASRSPSRIFMIICSAAWETSLLALEMFSSKLRVVSSISRIILLQILLFSFINSVPDMTLAFSRSAASPSGSTAWSLWSG